MVATPLLQPLGLEELQQAGQGLPLCDQPFDVWGRQWGVGGAALIEQLRCLLGQGVISGLGPVFAPDFLAHTPQAETSDQALIEAVASGLPLLPQPFEAVGAMLGIPASQVQSRLASWLSQGQVQRIGIVSSVLWP